MMSSDRILPAFLTLLLGTPTMAEQPSAPARNPEPHAAYPKPFSRPPQGGEDYDTWADACGPDVGQVLLDPARLPSRVDNSERPEFPPIYQQRWGTCGQYASVASIFTYEMNVRDGTVADTDATRFPTDFSWNMINKAENTGSEAYHGWEVAKRHGIPTIEAYGGVQQEEIGPWPDGYAIWHDAMRHRVAGYRYTPALTVAQLDEARGWLFDRNQPGTDPETIGGLLAMDGRMTKDETEKKQVMVRVADGLHEAGEGLWTRWGPSGFGHGLTCVGYDDEVGHDLNGDGKITNDLDLNDDGRVTLADWERGAYIVVNSWGAEWSEDGKVYLLYSAMTDPDWERGNYLGRVEVARHIPRWTLRLRLACDDRTDLRLSLGVSPDETASTPAHQIAPEAFNGWPIFGDRHGGHVPLAGPDDARAIEVGVDLTELLERLGPDARGRLFLTLTRVDGSELTGELQECALRQYDPEGRWLAETPLDVGGGIFGETPLELSFPLKKLERP